MATELKKEMLKLLREDEEFRYAVAGLIGLDEILRRLDRHEAELVKLREDMNKLREDMVEGFRRHDGELAELRRETNYLRGEMNRLREDMMKGFEVVNRHISAVGARWGLMAESAFREGLKGLLEEELGLRVERWTTRDEDGIVYGYPSEVEVDVAVKDGKTILIEIKSHARSADVAEFSRKVRLYSLKSGIKPDRLVLVTPYADEEALKAAKKLELEIYTKV